MIFSTTIPTNVPSVFVLHAPVAAAWGIPARYTLYTHRVRLRLALKTATVVATAWPLELTEELFGAVRQGGTSQQRADGILAALPAYRIYLDERAPHLAWPEILALVRAHDISVRDAAYLELALRLNLPLATTDADLTRAATAAGVAIFVP